MEFLADGLTQEELGFFNTDMQHIFDSLLDIDNETHCFDGIYRNYAIYLSGEINLRSQGIRSEIGEEATRANFNHREHWNE